MADQASLGPAAHARVMRPPLAAALLLMLASGAAALGYQIVWTQQAAVWLGHESAAVLAVVTAFFGGLALGSLALGPRIERSARPARWYAGCELLAAAWAGVLAACLAPAGRLLLAWTGPQPSAAWQWAVGFTGCLVLLLPATTALGASLPAVTRVMAAWPGQARAAALLYAANTAGAMLGALGTAWLVIPALGMTRSAQVCAALSAGCAALALCGLDRTPPAPPAVSAADTMDEARPAWQLAASGFLGIGYEVFVVRVLAQATEGTVYTFALLLAVYLACTALGAGAWSRSARVRRAGVAGLALALAGAVALSGAALWRVLEIKATLHDLLGAGLLPALAAEAALAALVFALPSTVMGALFAQLCHEAASRGWGFARALGVNTLGGALAPALLGVAAWPLLGGKTTWMLIVAGYLVLAATASTRPRLGPAGAALAGGAAALALQLPPLRVVSLEPGSRLVSHRDDGLGVVTVVEDAQGVRRLHIDNHAQEGSDATQFADGRQGLLPLLLHPAPRHALFVGLGTGVTAYTAAQDQQLRVDVVELMPAVVEASPLFTAELAARAAPPRVRVHTADARRWLRAGTDRYDLVVVDNVHPARRGTGALYSVEQFQAVKARLAEGGLFCQWLPLHQLDLDTLRSIVASFLEVYPQGSAWLATHSLDTPVIGLIAWRHGAPPSAEALRHRLGHAALAVKPGEYGFADPWALLGSVLADAQALARFARGSLPNRDDHPVVAHAAPRITYAPDASPRERLLMLLDALSLDPQQLWPGDGATAARVQAYAQARHRYLHTGVGVRATSDPQRMLDQVEQPLLEVLRLSPDFQPAREPLMRLAQAVATRDPGRAARLHQQLASLGAPP